MEGVRKQGSGRIYLSICKVIMKFQQGSTYRCAQWGWADNVGEVSDIILRIAISYTEKKRQELICMGRLQRGITASCNTVHFPLFVSPIYTLVTWLLSQWLWYRIE